MKVITAPSYEPVLENSISVFLAGGITGCSQWQDEVIEIIRKSESNYINEGYVDNFDDLVLFNPRREDFPIDDPSASYEQIVWEFLRLNKCDIFSMYFDGSNSIQPICLYELGRNIPVMQSRFPETWKARIVITCSEYYKRKEDVKIQTFLAFMPDDTSKAISQVSIKGVLEFVGDDFGSLTSSIVEVPNHYQAIVHANNIIHSYICLKRLKY